MAYESEIHERVWALFKAYGEPGARMLHIPNGEKRGKRTAAKLKRMGVVAGASDFLCGSLIGPFFLELKTPDGRLTKEQKDFSTDWAAIGVPTFVAWTVEDAVRILQTRGVLRADVKFESASHSCRGAPDGSEAPASDPSNSFPKEAVTAA